MKDETNTRSTIRFDYEQYAPLLDDPSLSEDQKRQILEALWTIVCSFVELGFMVVAKENCGEGFDEVGAAKGDVVSSEHSPKTQRVPTDIAA